jgi:hypothetical protein
VVVGVSTLAFVGFGLMAAVFPVMSAERGCGSDAYLPGSLLLVSGVYYPIEVLPKMDAAAVRNFPGNLHSVCLPKIVWGRNAGLDT